MIRLIVRGKTSAAHAKNLQKSLQILSDNRNLHLSIGCAPTLFSAGRIWHLLLRGKNPRAILDDIDLKDITIDIDPLECI